MPNTKISYKTENRFLTMFDLHNHNLNTEDVWTLAAFKVMGVNLRITNQYSVCPLCALINVLQRILIEPTIVLNYDC